MYRVIVYESGNDKAPPRLGKDRFQVFSGGLGKRPLKKDIALLKGKTFLDTEYKIKLGVTITPEGENNSPAEIDNPIDEHYELDTMYYGGSFENKMWGKRFLTVASINVKLYDPLSQKVNMEKVSEEDIKKLAQKQVFGIEEMSIDPQTKKNKLVVKNNNHVPILKLLGYDIEGYPENINTEIVPHPDYFECYKCKQMHIKKEDKKMYFIQVNDTTYGIDCGCWDLHEECMYPVMFRDTKNPVSPERAQRMYENGEIRIAGEKLGFKHGSAARKVFKQLYPGREILLSRKDKYSQKIHTAWMYSTEEEMKKEGRIRKFIRKMADKLFRKKKKEEEEKQKKVEEEQKKKIEEMLALQASLLKEKEKELKDKQKADRQKAHKSKVKAQKKKAKERKKNKKEAKKNP